MKKINLKSGNKALAIKVEHFVKLGDYATHLTDYFYKKNESFNKKITKKEAESILKKGLFFYGLNGEYETGHFDASYEEGEIRNQIYDDAVEWIKSKYDWLSQ